jgi:sulfonate dioxygenase
MPACGAWILTQAPDWDSVTYPPLEAFDHVEHGKDADPSFPNLLAGARIRDMTANIGAEVTGVQLSKLSNAGKDELAVGRQRNS